MKNIWSSNWYHVYGYIIYVPFPNVLNLDWPSLSLWFLRGTLINYSMMSWIWIILYAAGKLGCKFTSFTNELLVIVIGCILPCFQKSLQWRYNERDGVSNHRRPDCYSTVWSGAEQKKTSSSASLAFVRGIHRWPVNSPHRGPIRWKMLPFDDVIMWKRSLVQRGNNL